MDSLFRDIIASGPKRSIQLIQVNDSGQSFGNVYLETADIAFPVVQATHEQDIWRLWKKEWMNLVILDENNELLEVVDLLDYNLGGQWDADTSRTFKTHEELKSIILGYLNAP